MKLSRKKHFQPEVSTTSLNDIMFFLLLFFLIISTLSNPNVIKILLPKAQSAQKMNKQQVTVTVSEDKKYYIDQQEVKLDQLKSQLEAHIKDIESATIVLRFSPKLNVQDLVDVMQIGAELKVKMVLATQKTS
ncbi:MAG: biopolymer transporter ExbD [Bacteroidales bacterium]